MVTGIHYFGTAEDQDNLLDYLGEPVQVSLHPWPLLGRVPRLLTRTEALSARHVTIVSTRLGPPHLLRPGHPAMAEPTKSGLFNRLNWEHLAPGDDEGLIDSDTSPVLLWKPGPSDADILGVSDIGSQARNMKSVSADYERWMNRIMGWIRRHGARVWGLDQHEARPELDIDLDFVNNVWALSFVVHGVGRTPGRHRHETTG